MASIQRGFESRIHVGDVADHVLRDVVSPQEILDFVKKKGCCTLYTFGHQGGYKNAGGTVTYPVGSRGPVIIFPRYDNPIGVNSFVPKLGKLLKSNCAGECFINIVACGGVSDAHIKSRRRTAQSSGCTVCGGRNCNVTFGKPGLVPSIPLGGPPAKRVCWPNQCIDPSGQIIPDSPSAPWF